MAIKPPATGGKPPKKPKAPPTASPVESGKALPGAAGTGTTIKSGKTIKTGGDKGGKVKEAVAVYKSEGGGGKVRQTNSERRANDLASKVRGNYVRTHGERNTASKDYARTKGAVGGGKALPGTLGSGTYYKASGGGKVSPAGTGSSTGGSRTTRSGGTASGAFRSDGVTYGSRNNGYPTVRSTADHLSPESFNNPTTRFDQGSAFSSGGGPAVRPPTGISSAVRPNFEGGNESAGGQSGGATNPLAAGALSGLEGMNLEEVLHGAKKKGRIRRTRGTE